MNIVKTSKLKFFFKELDSKIEDAEKNLGDTEIREANLAKAEYLAMIGDKVCQKIKVIFLNIFKRSE